MADIFGGNPIGFNTFIPNFDASGKLVVHFSRDPKKFPLNKYISLVPTKKLAGYYLRINPQTAARLVFSRPEQGVWPDGMDAPRGEWNADLLDWKTFSCQRYATPYKVGELTVETADIDVLALYRANAAQQAMVRRTQLVWNQLLDKTVWGTHYKDGASDVLGVSGSYSVYDGTATDPRLKKLLQTIALTINTDTLGKVTHKDLQIIINPVTAAKLSQSQEVHTYLKESPYALAQLRGDVESQNGVWGLPDILYGFNVLVEDTVVVRYPRTLDMDPAGIAAGTEYPANADADPFAKGPMGYIVPDNALVVLARPGSLVTPMGPSFSTATIFSFQEMLVEERYDQDNKLYHGRVIDTLSAVVTAPVSGYYVANLAT